jgi:hypothetical protein
MTLKYKGKELPPGKVVLHATVVDEENRNFLWRYRGKNNSEKLNDILTMVRKKWDKEGRHD